MTNEMPKDIAKELRIRAAIEQVSGTVFERAANEIERLREDLEEARMLLGQMEEDYFRIREHNE